MKRWLFVTFLLAGLLALAACAALSATSHAQGPAFQSPGSPAMATMGQTTRFSRDFNPAFGFVIDTFVDYVDTDVEDGWNFDLRLL